MDNLPGLEHNSLKTSHIRLDFTNTAVAFTRSAYGTKNRYSDDGFIAKKFENDNKTPFT